MTITVYTSTVVARAHVIAGVVLGGVAVWLIQPEAVGMVVACVLVVTGVHLGTTRLAVDKDSVRVAVGPWSRSRIIPHTAIVSAAPVVLTAAEAFGIGLPWRWRTTRLTSRRGPALVITLADGETLRITTSDPGAAVSLMDLDTLTNHPRKDDR